MLSTSFYNR
jgi:hypothetical protein